MPIRKNSKVNLRSYAISLSQKFLFSDVCNFISDFLFVIPCFLQCLGDNYSDNALRAAKNTEIVFFSTSHLRRVFTPPPPLSRFVRKKMRSFHEISTQMRTGVEGGYIKMNLFHSPLFRVRLSHPQYILFYSTSKNHPL